MSPNTTGEYPVFCFRHVDRATKHKWVFKPDGDDSNEILTFLGYIAGNTWGQIEGMRCGGRNRHKKHHGQPIASIRLEAQKDISKRKLEETFGDAVFRFRLSDEKRLWGFRCDETFHVLWWDAGHDVYPTEPK